jgi:succinyl-CoA synthetase beta subunit
MKLRDYQSKKIFTQNDIPIPPGRITQSIEEVVLFTSELNHPVILKPQLSFKGRGKLGIIAFANSPTEAANEAKRLFELTTQATFSRTKS